jgi:hypothetical protein
MKTEPAQFKGLERLYDQSAWSLHGISDEQEKAVLREIKELNLTVDLSGQWYAKITEWDEEGGPIHTRAVAIPLNQVMCQIRRRCIEDNLVEMRGRALEAFIRNILSRIIVATIKAIKEGHEDKFVAEVKHHSEGKVEYV